MKHATTMAGLALALAATTAPLGAQQMSPPTGPPLPDSIQAMVQEFQSLRARISQVQDSAFNANPDLQDARMGVQEFIEDRMIEANPGIEEDMERLETLREEAMAAQQAQDQARMQEIMQEGTQLRNELAAAQASVMEEEAVQSRVEAFEDRMMATMSEIDGDIQQAFDRMEDLAGRLQAFQEGR